MLTAYRLPPTTYHLPPTAYHLPLTAYHPPPTAYCLPPTAYRLLWQERLEASERLATRREAGDWQTDLEWTLLKRLSVDAGTGGPRAAPALRTPAQAAEAREARRLSFVQQQQERERTASAEV